jgi:hypothetical protein
MGTIARKKYKCSVCEAVTEHQTNHFGEIYCPCPMCGSTNPLQCVEPEAIQAKADIKYVAVKITPYYFDVSGKENAKLYENLCENLQFKGLKMFRCISLTPHEARAAFYKKITELGEVHLALNWITENQWSTQEGFRVFDWREEIYPNKKIKEGYYLDVQKIRAEITRGNITMAEDSDNWTIGKIADIANKVV